MKYVKLQHEFFAGPSWRSGPRLVQYTKGRNTYGLYQVVAYLLNGFVKGDMRVIDRILRAP